MDNTKNRGIDLHNILFSQLERLSEEDLVGEKLSFEMDRSKAICAVSHQLIELARLQIDFERVENDEPLVRTPRLLDRKD